ncbi:MAG: hypothetical protein ACP5XB_25850 [Isosphaeraceae bacterium]
MESRASGRFFRGSELPRLLFLAAIMVAGWVVVWEYARARPRPPEAEPVATSKAEPVAADRAVEFETVTDRTPMSFRDNAAYAYLLEKARKLTPGELARQSRRDIVLTHLWERPELYRGVPIHLFGTALRTLRFESKLSKTGWLHEAWISTPDLHRVLYCCVFEEPPEGFPVGPNVSERVVFNGYFLKIMKYEAGDITRGAPVLVGKLGWEPNPASPPPGKAPQPGISNRLFWSLAILAGLFFVSLGRFGYQLFRNFSSASRPHVPTTFPTEDIPAEDLNAWVDSVSKQDQNDWEEEHGEQ